jgi:hypothetical protein
MHKLLILLILALMLAGCGGPDPVPTNGADSPPVNTTPYPEPTAPGGPTATLPTDLTPQPPEETFPPDPEELEGPRFTVLPPIDPSVSQIKGTGPAGLPIKLIDINNQGKTLSETTINPQGSFTFELKEKLTIGQQVAITLGNLAGTQFTPEQFKGFENYYEHPDYGTLLLIIEIGEATE